MENTDAVTRASSELPTSAETGTYVELFAFGITVHIPAEKRSQAYAYAVGSLLHTPGDAVSV